MGRRELAEWWLAQCTEEIDKTIPKAEAYSAIDLEIMGAAELAKLGEAGDLIPKDRREAHGMEMAIAFYALGKLSRIIGALSEGRDGGEDSWFDLGVYARMAQRVRETGQWPG